MSTIANLFFNLGHMSAEIDFGRYLIFFKTPNVMKFCIVRPHPNPISADPMLLRNYSVSFDDALATLALLLRVPIGIIFATTFLESTQTATRGMPGKGSRSFRIAPGSVWAEHRSGGESSQP